jgi:hydroxymethylbilane synthase
MRLRLGTRGSDLARAQAQTIATSLAAAGLPTELVIIRTSGDLAPAASFASIGPQGVFVREIEQAVLDGSIDLAVHSFKDLPTQSAAELVIAAVPVRVDAADVLVINAGAHGKGRDALLPLADGACVGTASARRRVWLKHFRPDLEVDSLRGNVPTRIKRLKNGDYDAILLAAAGIERLRASTSVLDAPLAGLSVVRLDPHRFVPAPAQGALAVQCHRDRAEVTAALARLDDAPSRLAVEAERDVLGRAEGGCEIAFGAHCFKVGNGFELVAMLERGGRVLTTTARGQDAHALGALAWRSLTTMAQT